MRIRQAGPADLDQIAALLVARGEPADELDHRLVVERAGWDCCAVAVDGDKVVSTLTLLDETVYLGGVAIPAGQVELVATDTEYEGRGLVRALMEWAHARSAARGHLMNVMLGIPYFYRQFGYSYVIPIEPFRPQTAKPSVDGYTIRPATTADIPTMSALQDRAQIADVRMPHSPDCWHWIVDRDGSTQWVVSRAGAVVATCRTTPPEEGVRLLEIAAVDDEAAVALLGFFPDATVAVRPGLTALEPYLGPVENPQALQYYLRVPDPVALLEHLRPVLSDRVAGFADAEVLLSFYRSHVRFSVKDGAVGPMRPGGVMQYAQNGAGCPPDLVPALLFGPLGIDGLRQRHPDVYSGPDKKLMNALFPPVSADLLTFYVY
ncbi:GNAT family N-acetyltransferase [Actinokineospora sp. HUAS TT18]|uniref:GNAT family N-acetyltransferase n=1 Tax=Actinokineospora sp. HUAS TT18 TaxID=3447451 RepID=UPI003F520ACB